MRSRLSTGSACAADGWHASNVQLRLLSCCPALRRPRTACLVGSFHTCPPMLASCGPQHLPHVNTPASRCCTPGTAALHPAMLLGRLGKWRESRQLPAVARDTAVFTLPKRQLRPAHHASMRVRSHSCERAGLQAALAA